jgi:leucyl aminopeptidase (aminopeptidase T)
MAFGDGFRQMRSSGRKGVNRSDLHVDVMIAGDDPEATGVDARGPGSPSSATASGTSEEAATLLNGGAKAG